MTAERSELHDAFVEAYPTYVAGVLVERRIEVDDVIGDAIVEGASVLDGLLTTLDATPVLDQRVSPLELFREALRPVNRALALQGAPLATDVPAGLATWDRYGLAPGSAQVLGERARDAHLRWGVEKAAAVARSRPRAVIVGSTEGCGALAPAVESLGYRLDEGLDDRIVVALVDVGIGAEAHDAIHRWSSSAAHTVAFGDGIDPLAVDGLKALGADVVVDTERLIDDPASYIPVIA